MSLIKRFLAIVVGASLMYVILLGLVAVVNDFTRSDNGLLSKSEYVESAVIECGEDGDICRCFYTEMLDRYSVREVMQFDIDVALDPEGYEYNREKLMILKNCLGTT